MSPFDLSKLKPETVLRITEEQGFGEPPYTLGWLGTMLCVTHVDLAGLVRAFSTRDGAVRTFTVFEDKLIVANRFQCPSFKVELVSEPGGENIPPSRLSRQVQEFHRMTGVPTPPSPTVPSEARVRLRGRLVIEEAFEFLEALVERGGTVEAALTSMRERAKSIMATAALDVDMEGVADALGDLDYVSEGTRLEFGVAGTPIADEIHRANMAKGVAKDEHGKTVKPPGWTPPDIVACLAKQGYPAQLAEYPEIQDPQHAPYDYSR